MLKLNETFGAENIKWFLLWNLLFAVYYLLLRTSILALVSLSLALFIAVKLVWQLVQKPKQGEQLVGSPAEQLEGWSNVLTDTLHEAINGTFNWLAKIFTNSDILEIGIGVVLLYLLKTFCFYSSDSVIVCLLGNLIILLRGFREYSKYYLSNFLLMKENIKGNLQQWLPKSSSK